MQPEGFDNPATAKKLHNGEKVIYSLLQKKIKCYLRGNWQVALHLCLSKKL